MTLPPTMRAMVLEKPATPLRERHMPLPRPAAGEVLLKVATCGVCRTDLHIVDNELNAPQLPLIPGHEIVGRVAALGHGVTELQIGDRVGVPWLGRTCGECAYCQSGRENLCDAPLFTGYTRNGGYAEYVVADQRFTFMLPDEYDDLHAAPLLCAGLIGYRTYCMAGPTARRIGLYGFGAAAHIVAQIALFEGRKIYAFTRPGDQAAQLFARKLGVTWAGDSDIMPPEQLDAALIFAPVGALVPLALRAVDKGGRVVCGGIHMSDIPAFPYRDLWEERSIVSVANLTRNDGLGLMRAAAAAKIRTVAVPFPLNQANEALACVREGRLEGAAVLTID